jgi:hypothetical protein
VANRFEVHGMRQGSKLHQRLAEIMPLPLVSATRLEGPVQGSKYPGTDANRVPCTKVVRCKQCNDCGGSGQECLGDRRLQKELVRFVDVWVLQILGSRALSMNAKDTCVWPLPNRFTRVSLHVRVYTNILAGTHGGA